MKAIRIHEHGTVDVLRIDSLTIPEPAAGEVLVKIKSASLNHLDLWVRRGIPGVPFPLIMGSDAAGIVEKVAADDQGSSSWKAGDQVIIAPLRSCGECGACKTGLDNLCKKFQIPGENCPGTQAEYVAVPEKYLFPKPEQLSWAEAAAFPLAGITAYHMLVQKVNLQASDTVLVWGASSGVGSMAIQIAKAIGARVFSTAGSSEKAALAERLGADEVIDYKNETVGKKVKELTGGRGVDVVFEHSGSASWPESLRALARGGKIVTCGATTGPFVKIDLRVLFIKHQQIIGSTMGTLNDLRELLCLIEAGKIKPVAGKVFPFAEIKQAHQWLEDGKNLGKVVLSF